MGGRRLVGARKRLRMGNLKSVGVVRFVGDASESM